MKQSYTHCDTLLQLLSKFRKGDNASGGNITSEEELITIYRILTEKVEQIKPHMISSLR